METKELESKKKEQDVPMTSDGGKPRKRKTNLTFIGESETESINTVVYRDDSLLVERTGMSLTIKPRTFKTYENKIRKGKKEIELTKFPRWIVIPPLETFENPIRYFEERYMTRSKNTNMQEKFIQKIWEKRDEIFREVLTG